MTHFGDPGFRYMTAMVEVWGRLALRLANAEIYPFDYSGYATTVKAFLDSLTDIPDVEQKLDLTSASNAAEAWRQEAARLQLLVSQTLDKNPPPSPDRFSELNQILLRVERQFLHPEGIPGRPWFKHLLYAPRYTYAAMSLPGVREAAEAQDWELASQQLELLIERFERVAELMRQAQTLVPAE
jgi:N-acetylated-alpha-linked acidic dipeptidase